MTNDEFCGLTPDEPPQYDCICRVIEAIRQDEREQIAQEQSKYMETWEDRFLTTYPSDTVEIVGRELIAIARGESK